MHEPATGTKSIKKCNHRLLEKATPKICDQPCVYFLKNILSYYKIGGFDVLKINKLKFYKKI